MKMIRLSSELDYVRGEFVRDALKVDQRDSEDDSSDFEYQHIEIPQDMLNLAKQSGSQRAGSKTSKQRQSSAGDNRMRVN